MKDINRYKLTEPSPSNLFKSLEKGRLFYHQENSSRKTCLLLDDYDWDIWQAGLALVQQNGDLFLINGCSIPYAGKKPIDESIRFWWELDQGPFSDQLKDLIDVRALTVKYPFELTVEEGVLRNPDQKIVVRSTLTSITNPSGERSCFIEFHPLRGYEKERSLTLKYSAAHTEKQALPDRSLATLLTESGLQINLPETKPSFELDTKEAAETAVTRMAARMIQLARHQEEGVIADIDTEFVHQYRVNIRKTRSLISLFKKTLSTERYQFLKSELKQLGSRTNELRDLDVFLLDHDYYRNMLPENLHQGFEELFKHVKRKRKTAYKRVVQQLTGDDYLQQISGVVRTLQQPAEFTTARSNKEIKTLASRKIIAQYQTIQSDGAAIGDKTPDEAVHDLRIECKKLRYLLELFIELYPKGPVKALIKQLKGLQDNLGRFNDFSVQQEFLIQFEQIRSFSQGAQSSLSGLAAVLYNKQRHERSLVVANIERFINPSVIDHFTELFEPTSPEENHS